MLELLREPKMSYLISKTFNDLYNLDAVKRLYANFDKINLEYDLEINKNKQAQKKYLSQLMVSKPTNYHFGNGKKSGRLYGGNLQFLKRELRNTICKEYYVDVDMKNSAPKILLWYCESQSLNTPILKEYCLNRDSYYHLKQDIIKIMNGGNLPVENNDDLDFLTAFKIEITKIHKNMMNHKDNTKIINTLKKTKKENIEGSLCNNILVKYESEILESAIKFLDERGVPTESLILMFDGFMLPNELFTNQLLGDLNQEIFKQTDIRVEFIKKEMNDCFVIPNDWEYDQKQIQDAQNHAKYLLQKNEFEKTFQKIISIGAFVELNFNEISIFPEHKLKISYKHLPAKFIDKWLIDPNILVYKTIGVYPKNCPQGVFNLWLPFDAELNSCIGDDLDAVKSFKFHISVLCNHEPEITTLIINWLGQMLQFPETKTFVPTFIARQGAGKGTLVEIMTKILGNRRAFETASPSQFVWGDFNGAMEQAFFVCLNEMSKKELGECDGKFKKLITDPTLRINKKGIESYDIQSFHRFLVCSNGEDPIKTSIDDRRNLIIQCSDELCDKEINYDYWIKMRKLINNPNSIKSIYNYLMDIPDLEYFHLTKLPRTEYHQDILDKNESAELLFIKHLAGSNQTGIKEYKINELIERFNEFKLSIGMRDYNINAPTLCLRLKNLKIKGLIKKHTRIGNLTLINYDELRTHFNIPFECEIHQEFETDF